MATHSSLDNYLSDTPMQVQKDDQFQRYGFAQRIAETLKNQNSASSIVVGIYGEWGEGKSTVLNFIEQNLNGDANIVVCKFNPWRFQDETQLLTAFFHQLASHLDKSLTTKFENVGKIISKYADLVIPKLSFFQGVAEVDAGGNIKKVADELSNLGLDQLKSRLEDVLKEEKRRIVFFVDDIDRLDRREIQAVFKLIKLSGNFLYTSYILAFDDAKVAKAIGEVYEGGGEAAGRSFLEKIIQVPLRLPAAPPMAMRKYCLQLIQRALNTNNIDLDQVESNRFFSEFTSKLLPYFTTPRVAVRYANALSFVLPLVRGEVNTVDLMLLEAIKVVLPQFYLFIRDHSDYLVKSFRKPSLDFGTKIDEDRKKLFLQHLSKAAELEFPGKEKEIERLLLALFPLLAEIYQNTVYSDDAYLKLINEKRLGSAQYFQRYFSYTVITGEVSDLAFEKFLQEVEFGESSENSEKLYLLLDGIPVENLLWKLIHHIPRYSVNLSKKLAFAISANGTHFPDSETSLFDFDSPLGLAALLQKQLIEKLLEKDDRFAFTVQLLNQNQPLEFSLRLFAFIRPDKSQMPEQQLFLFPDLVKLSETLLDRALLEANGEPIFKLHRKHSVHTMLYFWTVARSRENLMAYLMPIIDSSPELILVLLRIFTPTGSSGHSAPYDAWLEQRNYDDIQQILDVDYIFKILCTIFGDEIYGTQPLVRQYRPTDLDRARQFIAFYMREKGLIK